MAGNRDFIPRQDAAFDNWFFNLVNYVVAKTSGAQPAWELSIDENTNLLLRYLA